MGGGGGIRKNNVADSEFDQTLITNVLFCRAYKIQAYYYYITANEF